MSNYIAKAFVEVSNAEKMRDLYIDIKRSYGRPCDNTLYSPNGNVVVFNETETWTMFSKYPNTDHFIDCNAYANGDEDLAVKLFLELAEMNDIKISGSWTTFNERTILHKIVHEEEAIRRANYLLNTYGESGRATPLELAEAVRDGRIKLI